MKILKVIFQSILPSFNIHYKKFVVTPSINKKNWCVSLITSVEIINHHWVLQLIILKSCEDKWQAEDKSTDPSDQSEMGEKKMENKKRCNKIGNSLWI